MQEWTFSMIAKVTCVNTVYIIILTFRQISGLSRPAILKYLFEQPLIFDQLDELYKTETTKKVIFFYQPEDTEEYQKELKALHSCKRTQRSIAPMNFDAKTNEFVNGKKIFYCYFSN